MNFSNDLYNLLLERKEDVAALKGLSEWNEAIETYLFAASPPPPQQQQSKDDFPVVQVATELKRALIAFVLQGPGDEELLESVLERNHGNKNDAAFYQGWTEWIRACSNFCRWYLQVYLQQQASSDSPPLIRCFHSKPMLRFYLYILKGFPNQQRALTRQTSLLLFYATYMSGNNDNHMQDTVYPYLIHDLQFFPTLLEIFLNLQDATSFSPLALSLVRNVHNLLVSAPGARKIVLETSSALSLSTCFLYQESSVSKEITLPFLFRDMILHALSSEPPFPGDENDAQDRRADLVVEILGTFYALGHPIMRQICYPSSSDSQLLAEMIRQVFLLKGLSCKLSTMSLLMESNPNFAQYILEQSMLHKAIMEVLEIQVTKIVEQTQVDHAAAASLLPILAVLHRYSKANVHFCQQTKQEIFPPDREENFWKLVQEQKNNMSPLDAPRGTLRWKLIRLMTWTESYIKRLTTELLWSLCNENTTEFIGRTGMGNAVGFLQRDNPNHPASRGGG